MKDAPRQPRILIVDEEEALTDVLSRAIQLEGWETEIARTGATAVLATARFEPDVILIDIGLPDVPGTQVVAFLRERGMTTPVVFLTGRSASEDRAAGYAAGGDDYITKPFGLEEIVDHLKPLVRKLGLAPSSRTVADLVLDDESRFAWRGGRFIPLNPLEYEMLLPLVEEPNSRKTVGQLISAAAVRGVRVPRDFADRILQRVTDLVNGDDRALVHGDDTGWMLATA